MIEKQKEDIIKAVEKEGFEAVENIVDSHGINRKIIETKNLKTNTELALATLKKLKNDFWFNIFYIFLGFALGFVPASMNEDKTTKAIELSNKLLLEKNELQKHYETEVHQMRFELSSIKKELDSLKSEK
jgi:hypothetical protein